ncbi:MAG: 4Fe-4S dicluster domain-containing protein [Thermodesulfovibrionia bacterium]
MSLNRREFLKIAGLIGIGVGVSGANLFLKGKVNASEFASSSRSLLGKRWAMVVDVRRFKTQEDYKAVIEACHSIHNVPDFGNKKDEVKWIWTDEFEHAFPEQQNKYLPEWVKERPFPLLCNHCDNPPCVRVCPTKATFKRKDGIVMQDPHRCIGCRFCMAACPYGSRSFNWRNPRDYIKKLDYDYPTRQIGVVEKCTFCEERLAQGLQPACVEKSNGGLIFGDLADPNSEVRRLLSTHYTIRRKPELGTQPNVYYIIGGEEDAG